MRRTTERYPDLEAARAPCLREAGRIVAIAAKYYGLTAEDLIGPRRLKEVAEARMLAMYLMRHMLLWTWPRHRGPMPYDAIGRVLGNRDHTTVMHGVAQVTAKRRSDRDVRATLRDLRREIAEGRGVVQKRASGRWMPVYAS